MNKKVCFIGMLILVPFFLSSNSFAYEWGVKATSISATGERQELLPPYPINATLGEFRDNGNNSFRFHAGVDIYGMSGDKVYAIESGEVKAIKNVGTDTASITIGRFTYIHVDILENIEIEQEIKKGQLFAEIRDCTSYSDHLHMQEKDADGYLINPLRADDGLSGYTDGLWPIVYPQIQFFWDRDEKDQTKAGQEILYDQKKNETPILSSIVDILARVKDRVNLGIYQLGYQIKSDFQVNNGLEGENDYTVKKRNQIKFDRLLEGTSATWVYYYSGTVAGQSSGINRENRYYCYWATNKINANDYWDTTQHPDGKYTVSVLAWDIAGNGGDVAGSKGAASQKVIINNKRPVIKSISVADNSDADKMFKAGDKIELAIEFDEQLNPDKLPVLYIGAPKADGEKVEWIKVNVFFQMNRALS